MKFCFFYHQNLRDNKIKQNRVTSIETDHPMIRKKIVDNYELYAKQMFFFFVEHQSEQSNYSNSTDYFLINIIIPVLRQIIC